MAKKNKTAVLEDETKVKKRGEENDAPENTSDEEVPADDEATEDETTTENETEENDAPESEGERGDVAAEKRGIEKERGRQKEIRSMVRRLDLPDSIADDYINKGVTVEQARAAVIDKMAKQDEDTPTKSNIRLGEDITRKSRSEGMENYILHRVNPGKNKLDDNSKNYRGMSLLDLAREIVGHKECRGLNKMEIVKRAFHSTSDFTDILANVTGKSLRQGYADTKKTFQQFARQITLPDFRERKLIALSNAPNLELVLEGGEYKYGTLIDGAETINLSTYGKIIAITRQAIVNDDLDAFTRIPQRMAAAAGRLENRMVYDLLTSNPTMSDGYALFSAEHGNLTDALLADGSGIGAIRALMRVQTDPSGNDILNYEPDYLIVPAALEETALRNKATIVPNQISQAQPYANTYDVISDGYLDGTSTAHYYMAADPSQADGLVYGYLEGEEGPYLETRDGFNRDGIEFKVRHDFGVGVEDFRGLAKSTNDAS